MQKHLNLPGESADGPGMDFNALLRTAVERGASDLHLKVGQPPVIRHDGALAPLEGWEQFNAAQLEAVLGVIGASAPARLAAFHETGELDTSYQEDGLPRFRVNAFRQRGDISFAMRVIPDDVPTFDSLLLPQGVRNLAEEQRGLILVDGVEVLPTTSGRIGYGDLERPGEDVFSLDMDT